MNRRRASAYGALFIALYTIIGLAWSALSGGGIDPLGRALGTDFTSFWAASKLALEGRATDVYRSLAHFQAQKAAFNGADIPYSAFFYPPPFLVICLPLALLPYLPSLAVWLGLTAYAWGRVISVYLGQPGHVAILVFAFPAVFINIAHGQNGFLTAALFAGGLLIMPARPLLAGVLLGSLVFKPHLALVLPIALALMERWRTFLAALLTAIAWLVLSLVLFGAQTWSAFFDGANLIRAALQDDLIGHEKMQSAFAAVRLVGGSTEVAYAVHISLALGVCCAMAAVLWRNPGNGSEAPLVAAAAPLMSPFMFDYDLTLLAAPLAWLAQQGNRTGFRPWEKAAITAGFLFPLLSRPLATGGQVQLAPLVLLLIFVFVLKRATELDTSKNRFSRGDLRENGS